MLLLPRTQVPVLRLYRWRIPCLSVGYFQSALRDIDLDRCRSLGIDVVRRLTGGRAILHQEELTYSLVASQTDPVFAGGVLESYARVSQGLMSGLRRLGVVAQALGPWRGAGEERSPACFDAISGYEIAVEGRKLVGSAQVRRGGVVLQQGSILLRVDAEALFRLFCYSEEAGRRSALEGFRRKVTSLAEMSKTPAPRKSGLGTELGEPPSLPRLTAALRHGFAEALGLELLPSRVSLEERALARRLAREKYGNPGWNLMR